MCVYMYVSVCVCVLICMCVCVCVCVCIACCPLNSSGRGDLKTCIEYIGVSLHCDLANTVQQFRTVPFELGILPTSLSVIAARPHFSRLSSNGPNISLSPERSS